MGNRSYWQAFCLELVKNLGFFGYGMLAGSLLLALPASAQLYDAPQTPDHRCTVFFETEFTDMISGMPPVMQFEVFTRTAIRREYGTDQWRIELPDLSWISVPMRHVAMVQCSMMEPPT